MRIFVTGATGFIGMAVVSELVAAGHDVLGLCRSPDKAAALAAAGAEESIEDCTEDLESLKTGAARSDGVIHLAFKHELLGAGQLRGRPAHHPALRGLLAGSKRPAPRDLRRDRDRRRRCPTYRPWKAIRVSLMSSFRPRTKEAAASMASNGRCWSSATTAGA